MSTTTPQYEFTPEQDTLVASLGHKMGWVGFLLILIGVVNLLSAAMLGSLAYQDQLPAEVVERVPAEAMEELEAVVGGDRQQTLAFAINTAINGLITLLFGLWIRGGGVSFGKIATTAGRDISHLMSGLGSLNRMFGVIYFFLMFLLIMLVIGVGSAIFANYAAEPGAVDAIVGDGNGAIEAPAEAGSGE